MLFKILMFFVLQFGAVAKGEQMTAQVTLYAASSVSSSPQIVGTIKFTQESATSAVHIVGSITLPIPNTQITATSLGFHVHQYGLLDANCNASKAHYNPLGVNHGAPWDKVRHVGDLGNVNVSSQSIPIDFSDSVIQLKGSHSIIGRALVLHSATDDLGRNASSSDSLTTGSAGSRVACGVIGISSDFNLSDQGHRSVALMDLYQCLTLTAAFLCVARFFV